jgi:hypothetical protein
MSNRTAVLKKSAKWGNDREKVRRVPFGLGEAPGTLGAAEKCLRCSFGNIPVIEEVIWTIPLPLTVNEAAATFGDTVNLLSGSSSVPGVQSIDSTFLINGILQTDILAQGIGVHVFCEPMSFSTIGNAFLAPAATVAPSPSPDVYTSNDFNNGAFGSTAATSTIMGPPESPADFEWGADVWRAGWNFINAYQFQWKTSQRELVLNESAADISYFGSFADAMASGTSEVPVIEYVATANATYRAKGSTTIFLPVNFRRVGSVTQGLFSNSPTTLTGQNIGIFHPTRDFDLAPVTWGGLRWQGYGCKGQMYRPIESPCFIERGIPVGMIFVAQDAVHQASMLEALTINNEPLGLNIAPDVNVSSFTFPAANIVPAAVIAGSLLTTTSTMLEQTLDATPVYAQQVVNVDRQVFKGGVLKLAIKIKGWEMPGGWKAYCQTNLPQIMQGASPAGG